MIDAITTHQENQTKSVSDYEGFFAEGNLSYGELLRPGHSNTENLLPHQGHLQFGIDADVLTQLRLLSIAKRLLQEKIRHWTKPENVSSEEAGGLLVLGTLDPSRTNRSDPTVFDMHQFESVFPVHFLDASSLSDKLNATSLRQKLQIAYLELNPNQIKNEVLEVSTIMSGMERAQLHGHPDVLDSDYLSRPEIRKIVESLMDSGKIDAACRIVELDEIVREESDDDQQKIQLDSLRSLADFFTKFDFPYLPHGCITVGYDGVMGAGWTVPLRQQPTAQWRNWDGILSLKFLPSGEIRFAGETRPTEDEVEFYDLGTGPHEEVFSRITPFFNLLRLIDAEK